MRSLHKLIPLLVLDLSFAGTANAQTPSLDAAVAQTSGTDTHVYPVGVPKSYSWYAGGPAADGAGGPPSNFTSSTAWGQVYPQVGQPAGTCNVDVREYQSFIHLKAGGWVKVQDQAADPINGAHFSADFHGSDLPMTITIQSDGSTKMASPPPRDVNAYNDHFWPGTRGDYTAGTVDGAFSLMKIRQDSATCNLIASAGIDWWQNNTAALMPDESTNPGYSGSSWLKLTTSYQYLYSTRMTRAQLTADPPPPCR
jgi:hypothetical protein